MFRIHVKNRQHACDRKNDGCKRDHAVPGFRMAGHDLSPIIDNRCHSNWFQATGSLVREVSSRYLRGAERQFLRRWMPCRDGPTNPTMTLCVVRYPIHWRDPSKKPISKTTSGKPNEAAWMPKSINEAWRSCANSPQLGSNRLEFICSTAVGPSKRRMFA